MTVFKGWSAILAIGGVLALGGLGAAAAQQQEPPQIDVDRLVAELSLSGDAKAAVAAQLDELNGLLARRARIGQESGEVHSELAEVFSSLLSRLTPDQRRLLHRELRGAGAFGAWGGHMGSRMGSMHQGTMGWMHQGTGFGRGHGCGGLGPMGSMGWGMGPGGQPRSPSPGAGN